MLIVKVVGMECSVMSLLAPVAKELNALNKGDKGTSETDVAAFGKILSALLSKTSKESTETVDADKGVTNASPIQGTVLSPVIQQEIPQLLQLLASIERQQAQMDGPPADGEQTTATSETIETSQEQEAGKLLLRMVADLMNRLGPKTVDTKSGAAGFVESGVAKSDEGGLEPCADRMSSDSGETGVDLSPATDEKLLQSLALLLFDALVNTGFQEQRMVSSQTSTAGMTEDDQTGRQTVNPQISDNQPSAQIPELMSPSHGVDGEKDGSERKASVESEAPLFPQPGVLLTVAAAGGATRFEKAGTDTEGRENGRGKEQIGQGSASEAVAHGAGEDLAKIHGDSLSALSGLKDSPSDRFKETMSKLLSIDAQQLKTGESPKDSGQRADVSPDEAQPSLFLLKGTLKGLPQAFPAQAESLNGAVALNDGSRMNVRALIQSGEGMLSAAADIRGEDCDRNSNGGDSGERGGQGSAERQPFVLIDQSSADRSINLQKAAIAGNPVSTAAVDRLERIAAQTSGRNNHDLTVKLDVGNEETVVVGLKDLGRTIAVDVKASHQGLINLFESQKETIMRHLESREVRAAISVDPDASRNPEGRERRETRERAFRSARNTDGTFGRVLEIVA